jgi:hypothetical protein
MAKLTRGKDGRLYNGKGTRGGLAPSKPDMAQPALDTLPTLPEASSRLSDDANKPRPDKIQLAAAKLSALKATPPETIADLSVDIESEANTIEFPNHNAASGEDWLTLEELIENDNLYENNCDAVSGEIYNYLEEMASHYPEISKIDLVQLNYNKGAHVAVTATIDESEWVLDYTAKQFDSSLPVPLLVPRQEWENLIDAYIWVKHKDSRA